MVATLRELVGALQKGGYRCIDYEIYSCVLGEQLMDMTRNKSVRYPVFHTLTHRQTKIEQVVCSIDGTTKIAKQPYFECDIIHLLNFQVQTGRKKEHGSSGFLSARVTPLRSVLSLF